MKRNLIASFCFLLSFSGFAQTLKEAIHLTDNEQYEAAQEAFKKLLLAEPSNGTHYYYYGENYLLSDEQDSALMMFEKGLQVEPGNALNLIGKAKYKLNKYGVAEMKSLSDRLSLDAEKAKKDAEAKAVQDPEEMKNVNELFAKAAGLKTKYAEANSNVAEANTLIDQAVLKAGPKNALAMMEAADGYIKFKNKNLDRAKELLDKAAQVDPKNIELMILYGDLYSEMNNGTLAAEYYNKAIDADKNAVKAIVNKGKLYKRSTNLEGAAEEFQRAIKIDPAFAPAHSELAEVYIRMRHFEKAKEELRAYLELSKNNKRARIRYAALLVQSEDYKGAINEINQLSKFDPDNIRLLRIATYSYYEIKDSAKALQSVEALFSKLNAESTALKDYEYYGKILAANKKDSLAVIYLRKAYDLDITRCDLLNEISKSYINMKKNAEAAQVILEKIQNCKGVTSKDYFELGRSYLFARDFFRADTAFAKLNELAPKYATGWLYRAKANFYIDSTGDQGLAIPFYDKFIEVTLSDTTPMTSSKKMGLIEAYKSLAAIFVNPKRVNLQKLKDYSQKILELDPDDKDAKKWLESIENQQKQPPKKNQKP